MYLFCKYCHWRRFLLEEGGWWRDRDAEGIDREENGEGVSPPQPTKGSRERRKLPQRGPGRSPDRKRVLVHSELEKTHVVTTNLVF